MAAPKPNEMITCPYNECHQVEHYRFHVHLQKCRKQYPNCMKVICPFDATHVVNDIELDYHVTTCPKRYMLDSQMYVMDDDFRPQVYVQPVPQDHTEASWDNDNHESYKPDVFTKNHLLINKVKGGTPSERRKARMEAVKNYKPLE